MIKVGLREASRHFSKYMKLVRQGQVVVVTEQRAPIRLACRHQGAPDLGYRFRGA